jgi:hypothetical protein
MVALNWAAYFYMKGILLMAFGKPVYGKYAFNMLHSIKHLNKSLPVHLICDQKAIGHIHIHDFDSFEVVEFSTDLGFNKIDLFDKSPFTETLYLDVDGICLNDPALLFKELKGEYIWTQPMGSGTVKDNITYNWASPELVFKKFNLDGIFTTCQTSIIYFNKSKEAKTFFKKLKENYKKRLDPKEYLFQWNKSNNHPDELYYSITLNQVGVSLKNLQPVFFPKAPENIGQILKDYSILSMWGKGIVKPYAKTLYDRILFNVFNAIGENHYYKSDNLYRQK